MEKFFASILSRVHSFVKMLLKAEFRIIYSKLMRYNHFAYYELDNSKQYQRWHKLQHKQIEDNISRIISEMEGFECKPLISILLILDTRKELWLSTIQSVIDQLYTNWELCIATTSDSLDDTLRAHVSSNYKINIRYTDKISNKGVILNNLLKSTKGKYICEIKPGDEFAKDALYSYVQAINLYKKNFQIIYADEDRIDENHRHIDPFFKPQFSPELLYSLDYISRSSILNIELVNKVSGYSEDLKNCHSYELILKLIDMVKVEEVCHIPKILYHSRNINSESIGQSILDAEVSCQILENKLQEGGIKVKVIPFKVDYERVFHRISPYGNQSWPKVSIIIPTKDKATLLQTCINSIKCKTTYPNYEIIIIDNQSREPQTLEYLDSLEQEKNFIKIIKYDQTYNYSAMNNYAVNFAEGEILCFLNNDTEVITSGWLEEMVYYLLRPGVGAVGAKLYYPISNRIQHAGLHVAHNPYIKENANHIILSYCHQMRSSNGYLNNLWLVQNLSAVVGACFIVQKQSFLNIGGFDAENTPTSYSEVDLCFRLRDKGYRIVWTPYVELYHYEGASRGLDIHKNKLAHKYMIQRWPHYLNYDIYVNPNLSFYYKSYPVLLDLPHDKLVSEGSSLANI